MQNDCNGEGMGYISRRMFLGGAAGAILLAACAGRGQRLRNVRTWGEQGRRDGMFLRPRALGVHGEHIYVIDTTGRVQAFDRNAQVVAAWSMPESGNGTPTAIAFHEDRVIIPDTHYSRIIEYAHAGDEIRRWGSYGSEPGKFIYPTGIMRAPEGLWFLPEYGQDADRVQVFDDNRQYVRHWGALGDEPGTFNRAMGIALGAGTESAGYTVWVADTGNHRVQRFAPDGTVIGVVGGVGAGPGQLRYPHDIATAHDGTLFVAEYGNNRISRFDASGQFITCYGEAGRGPGQFNAPRGVAVSPWGELFVADTDNHRIQAFTVEGLG